jgi:hypothetical protein
MFPHDALDWYEKDLEEDYKKDLEEKDTDYWYEKLVNEERLFNPYAR